MAEEDKFMMTIHALYNCPEDQKAEFLEGLALGYKIAYLSATNKKRFSIGFVKFLYNQTYQIFSLNWFFETVKEITDIQVADKDCTTSGQLLKSQLRTQYLQAVDIAYRSAMTAYDDIAEYYFEPELMNSATETYHATINAFLNSLQFTLMTVK